jgi:hypothetical protein
MNPTKIIKNLLPNQLNWVKDVVDVEYTGEVNRYTNSGISIPTETWEEYEISIKIDYSLLEHRGKCTLPDKNPVTNRWVLEKFIGYAEFTCLGGVLYEINLLTSSNYKYEVKIVDSDNLQDRPF